MLRVVTFFLSLTFFSCNNRQNNDQLVNSTSFQTQSKMNEQILGTYVLKSWRSLDSARSVPPIQKGTMTFDGTRRIFTFAGRDDLGNDYAEMYVAKYKLKENSYTEIPEYLMLDHHHGSAPAVYDYEEKQYTSSVQRENEKLTFALPHPFENTIPVVVEFNGDSIRARIGNEFEYFWVKE